MEGGRHILYIVYITVVDRTNERRSRMDLFHLLIMTRDGRVTRELERGKVVKKSVFVGPVDVVVLSYYRPGVLTALYRHHPNLLCSIPLNNIIRATVETIYFFIWQVYCCSSLFSSVDNTLRPSNDQCSIQGFIASSRHFRPSSFD